MRRQPVPLIQRLTAHPAGAVGISSITLAELAQDAEKSARPEQNRTVLEQILLPLDLADVDPLAALVYGRPRARLESEGQTIGAMDLLIASHAISLETTLVTNNVRDFQRVAGLTVEDWVSAGPEPCGLCPEGRRQSCAGYTFHPYEFDAQGGRDTLSAHIGNYDPLEDKRLC